MSKVVLCGSRNTFASFSKDELHVWHAQHFGDPHRHCRAAGAAPPTCRVACFLQVAMSGLHQVVTPCKFRGSRGIL